MEEGHLPVTALLLTRCFPPILPRRAVLMKCHLRFLVSLLHECSSGTDSQESSAAKEASQCKTSQSSPEPLTTGLEVPAQNSCLHCHSSHTPCAPRPQQDLSHGKHNPLFCWTEVITKPIFTIYQIKKELNNLLSSHREFCSTAEPRLLVGS